MSDNLKPPFAANLWVNHDILFVELPSVIEGAPSHTLRLPNNVWGMSQVVQILQVRNENSTIGTRGDPTQAQAEAEMKKLAKVIDPTMIKRPKGKIVLTRQMRASAASILKRFGISA